MQAFPGYVWEEEALAKALAHGYLWDMKLLYMHVYACVCNLLTFLLLSCLLFNAFIIIQTLSREESGTLSR
jgi:hypothetical protein